MLQCFLHLLLNNNSETLVFTSATKVLGKKYKLSIGDTIANLKTKKLLTFLLKKTKKIYYIHQSTNKLLKTQLPFQKLSNSFE